MKYKREQYTTQRRKLPPSFIIMMTMDGVYGWMVDGVLYMFSHGINRQCKYWVLHKKGGW